jgi:hypothetical protein
MECFSSLGITGPAHAQVLSRARFNVGQQASKVKSQLGWNHLASVQRYEHHTYLLDQGIRETISAGWGTAIPPSLEYSLPPQPESLERHPWGIREISPWTQALVQLRHPVSRFGSTPSIGFFVFSQDSVLFF